MQAFRKLTVLKRLVYHGKLAVIRNVLPSTISVSRGSNSVKETVYQKS